MSNYLNLSVPTFVAYLDTGFLYDKEPSVNNERILVEIFNFTSIPQRCGLFSVMTEYGSQHARVPIHYIRSTENGGTDFPLDWIQLWDSMSYYASVNIIDYLKNRAANVILKNKTLHKCTYMYAHPCTFMYIDVHLCTCMYIYVHLCTFMHIYVHLCTFLQI